MSGSSGCYGQVGRCNPSYRSGFSIAFGLILLLFTFGDTRGSDATPNPIKTKDTNQMLNKTNSLFGLILLLSVTISAQAQKVSVGFDRAADFSKFKTFTWAKGSPAKNPEIDKEIIANIEQQLTLKGLTRTTGNADVNISYSAAVMTGFDEANVAKPGTWGPRAGSSNQVWEIKKGALLVTMKGANNEELWRATATDTLSQDANADVTKDMEKARKKVRQAVEKIFKYYPPK